MINIFRKELKLFFSDKRALLLTFLLPIAIISLFALAFGGAGRSDEARPYVLPVADLDSTEESQRVIALLDSEKSLLVVQFPLIEGQEAVKKGEEPALLIFHKGFSDSAGKGAPPPIELLIDEAKEAEVGLLQQALYSKLFSITGSAGMKKKVLSDIEKQYAHLDSATLDNIKKQVEENFSSSGFSENSGDPGMKVTRLVAAKQDNTPGLVQAVAGTAVMMLLFSVAAMGASLLSEKEEGTLKKLLTSPIHPNAILFAKMLSSNLVSVMQLIVMFLYAWILFGLDIFQNIPALALHILATAFACSSFGMLLASIAKTRSQVQGISTLIILTMSAIGGSMIPTFIMPEWMQKISVISVNYWSIQGFFDIFWRSLSISDFAFLKRVLILFAIGTVMTAISMRLFKKNVLKLY